MVHIHIGDLLMLIGLILAVLLSVYNFNLTWLPYLGLGIFGVGFVLGIKRVFGFYIPGLIKLIIKGIKKLKKK